MMYYLGIWRWTRDSDEEPYGWQAPAGCIGALDLRPPDGKAGFGVFAMPDDIDPGKDFSLLGESFEAKLNSARLTDLASAVGLESIEARTLSEALMEIVLKGDPQGKTRTRPLLPVRGKFTLHLGGDQIERAFAGVDDPAFANVQARLQVDYRAIKEDADRIGGKAAALPAKWLETTRRQLDLTDQQAVDLIIPADLVKISPQKPSTTNTDDFSGDLSAWTDLDSAWTLVAAKAACVGANHFLRHDTPMSSADHYVQAKIDQQAYPGVVARMASSGLSGYRYLQRSAFNIKVQRLDGGVATDLSVIATVGDGITLKLDCSGTTLTPYINGVEQTAAIVTDSNYSDLYTGLMSGGTGTCYIDDYEASDGISGSTYTLTVNNGTGGGTYEEEDVVAVSADAPASGYKFSAWTGDTEYLDDPTSASANVTMPADDVTITATYVAAGFYRVYLRLAPNGDDVLIDTLENDADEFLIDGALAASGSEAWYHVRSVSPCGVEDDEPIRLVRVAFDESGALISAVPNAPIGLQLTHDADGNVTVSWSYNTPGQAAAPASFNVFAAVDGAAFDFDTPDAQVTYYPSYHRFAAELGPYTDGQSIIIIVRSVASGGSSEVNWRRASITIDLTAPDAPASINVEVTAE